MRLESADLASNVLRASIPGVSLRKVEHSRVPHRGIKEQCTVAWMVAGSVQTWRRGATRRYAAGSIMVGQPGDVHNDRKIEEPVSYRIAAFTAARVREARAALDAGDSPALELGDIDPQSHEAAQVRRMHRALFDGFCSPELQDEAVHDALEALVRLGQRSRPLPKHEAPRAVERAKDYIRAHLADTLRVSDIAAAVELDQFRLIRAFREHVGLSPYEWLTQLRIQQAKALLVERMPATQVAQQLGYCDQSQLHRHFRRIVGVTPGAYARAFRSV